jgi:hypothetical protein
MTAVRSFRGYPSAQGLFIVAVNDVTAYLQSHPESVATIIGRTDTVGSSDYNMRLSHRRADAVRDALVYNGKVAAERVETRWTGESRQDVPTANNTAAAGNRVVDIASLDFSSAGLRAGAPARRACARRSCEVIDTSVAGVPAPQEIIHWLQRQALLNLVGRPVKSMANYFVETIMKIRMLILLAFTLLSVSACVVEPLYGDNSRGEYYRSDHDYGRRAWH